MFVENPLHVSEKQDGIQSMTQAILACISLMLLAISWIIYKKNFELFLCLLIVLYNDCFCLTPQIPGRPDDYKLLLLPIILILLAVNLFTGKLSFGRYGWWVISFLGLSVLAVVVAWFAGQDFSLGIKAVKFVPLVLVYFLLAGRRVDGEKFAKYFIFMAIAVAFIASIQYLALNKINLFPGLPKEILTWQKVQNRITVGSFVISAAVVVAFARYQQSSRIMFLLAAAALCGQVIVVGQTRALVVAIFLTMFITYVLSHKFTALRLAAYMFFAGFCLCGWLFLQNVDFSHFSLVKRTTADFTKRGTSFGSSYQARLNSYDYYWKEILKQPITGRGIWNFNWAGDNERTLQKYRGIHLSDIGITHFIVEAGLVGFMWLLYGLLRIWKDIFRFRGQLAIASYFVIATFTMPTIDLMFRNDNLFVFAVFLGISSSMITAAKTDKVLEGV